MCIGVGMGVKAVGGDWAVRAGLGLGVPRNKN